DPPETADASDIATDEFEMSEAPSADDDIGNLDDLAERASEIDDVTDSMLRRAEPGDDFDAIVGEIDYSDVDVPALLAEREEYKGLAQRIQADFDNYRRRAAAQSLAEADRASGRLAEALLPVLDAAEAAYLRHPEEVGPLLNQMLVELKKHGLETLDLEDKPFDPEFAEAVAHEPGDGGEPIVAEVLRSGYTWKGKVLRAAMVKTKD
ncbi:MAG: nucleotide exchange factor GrpE, partial [Ilumatobacteraceae bacterium]